MATLSVLTTIGKMALSFLIAFGFYYVVSPLQNKKKIIEEVFSSLINFVIYIWVSKILLRFALFIQDPLAVLAYPSDSKAFYLALLLSGIHIGYKTLKKQYDFITLWKAFIPIFLVASFVYECIQLLWMEPTMNPLYLTLLFVLLLIYLFNEKKWLNVSFNLLLMIGWNIGKLLLAITLPFTTIFGYTMVLWFLSSLLLLHIIWFFYDQRRVRK